MNVRVGILLFIFAAPLASCSKNDGHSNEIGNPTPTPGPTPDPATDTCPWDLKSTKTATDYKSVGITIQLDCGAINDPNARYTKQDLDKTLQLLDSSLSIVKESTHKPTAIRLGSHAFHELKENFIQVKLGDDRFNVAHFIDTTLKLMAMEESEFNGQIRFGYSEIRKKKDASGVSIDIGYDLMYAPPAEFVVKDLLAIKKFKQQILSRKDSFPDVILFHGSSLSYFQISTRNSSYTLPTEAPDDINVAFFNYLANYERLVQNFSPLTVNVNIFRDTRGGHQADFAKSNHLIDVALALKSKLMEKPLQEVLVEGRNPSSSPIASDQILLSFNGRRLIISNLFDSLGDPQDLILVKNCLESQDFSQSFTVKCPEDPGI